MTREALVIAALAGALAVAQGQSSSALSQSGTQHNSESGAAQRCACPPPKLEQFKGHVLDDATGKPIAGAEVHYLDDNPPRDEHMKPVRGFISGSITTAADGSYALPADLPLATYRIRAQAAGYYAARINASPRIVGQRDLGFPFNRQSPEIRLKRSPQMVAFGASKLEGAENKNTDSPIGVASFAPDGGSLMVAAHGPGLWLITLDDGQVRRIELPAEVNTPKTTISQLGWDGKNLVFAAGGDAVGFVGGATAPDFKVGVLAAPNPEQVKISMGIPYEGVDGFTFDEGSDCDEPGAGPHCGQGGYVMAHNGATGKTTRVFSAGTIDLGYLHDPVFGGLIAFADETRPQGGGSKMMSEDRFTPGITLLNLVTHEKSHIELPGAGGRHIDLLAERVIPETSVTAMRLAYTVEGDCDPRSTDKAQPFAPGGGVGFTENNWSLCVVTIPVPPQPVHRAGAVKSSSSRRAGGGG